MTQAITDEQLLEEFIATGDAGKFRIIHDRHAEPMTAFLATKYLGGDLDLAADVVQDTFLKLVECHDQYNREHRLRPWLFSIAANMAIDIQRHSGRRPAVSFGDIHVSGGGNSGHKCDEGQEYQPEDVRMVKAPEDATLNESLDIVRELLELLSTKDKAAIEAVYFRGQSFSEAAAELGIPLATAKTRVYRALEIMRTAAASKRLVA